MNATQQPRPPRRRRARRRKKWVTPRDFVFFAAATATYVHEFWTGDQEATLLGLFAIFLFLGFIPAFKADEKDVPLTLAGIQAILIRLLGGDPPDPPESPPG